MNPAPTAEAIEFGAAAARAFADLGGVDCAREAEADPALRGRRVAPALAGLGVADLDPRADIDTACAAGELCRAAGRVALPYPVVGALLADDGRPLTIGSPVDHGDLFPEWRVADLHADVTVGTPIGGPLGSKLGPFVTDVAAGGAALPADPAGVVLHLTLTAWQILGTVERAVELAVEHVTGRIQFGQPISAFQAVQFQLADASVAVDGLREMCRFTLWRTFAVPDRARPDALAARLAALDSARSVLRITQQLHGAAGVCDEYDISVLCRHVQPALRLPFGAERTATEMAAAVADDGFDSLFAHGGVR